MGDKFRLPLPLFCKFPKAFPTAEIYKKSSVQVGSQSRYHLPIHVNLPIPRFQVSSSRFQVSSFEFQIHIFTIVLLISPFQGFSKIEHLFFIGLHPMLLITPLRGLHNLGFKVPYFEFQVLSSKFQVPSFEFNVCFNFQDIFPPFRVGEKKNVLKISSLNHF